MCTSAIRILRVLIWGALITAALACPTSVECPVHEGLQAYLTDTRVVDGTLLGVYHCPRGHDVLARCGR